MNQELRIKNQYKKRSMLYAQRFVRGFSLVETIVAVAIIVLAIVGPITSAQKGLVSGEYSKDQMRANYLAEEGLEYIHYVRDVNAINENDWLNGLDYCLSPGNSEKACGIDPNNAGSDIIDCKKAGTTDLTICRLNFDPITTGIYTHQSGGNFVATPFRRWIKIYDEVNSFEKKVIVSVEWKTGSLPKKTITVTGSINDWKKQPSI